MRSTTIYAGSTLLAVLLELLPEWLQHHGASHWAVIFNVIVIKLAIELASSPLESLDGPTMPEQAGELAGRYLLWIVLIFALQSPGVDLPRRQMVGKGVSPLTPVRVHTPHVVGPTRKRLLRITAGTFSLHAAHRLRRRCRPARIYAQRAK